MFYNDDFSFDENESNISESQIREKINFCIELIAEGLVLTNLDTIEETIHYCLDYDFIEDGLVLTDAALEVAPYNSDFWQYRGIINNNTFDFEEAYFSFTRSFELNPFDIETLLNKAVAEENIGLVDDAKSTLEKALTIEPKNEEALYSLGILCARQDDYQAAIEYFILAVEADETYSEAWYELGMCYDNLENYDKSLFAYDKFLDIEPYSYTGLYNKGIVQIRKENFSEAINCFELSLAINDGFSSAWFNLGVCYAAVNNHNKAVEAFRTASEIDPQDETLWYYLGQSFEEQNLYNEAIESYNNSINLDDEYYEAYLARGFCFDITGKKRLALDDFNKAITITGETDILLKAKAEVEYSLGQIKESIISYKKLLELDKNNFEIWQKLAETYIEAGDWHNGLQAYETCIKIKPEHANSYYGKAKINFLLTQTQDAIESLKSAFSLDPNTMQKFDSDYPDVKASKLFGKLIDNNKK